MHDLHKRHDYFIRRMLNNIDYARRLFSRFVRDDIACFFDWQTLEPVKADIIDSTLQEQIVDGLWKVQTKSHDKEALLLFEHFSTPQKYLGIKILHRITGIKLHYCERYSEEKLYSVVDVVLNQSDKHYHPEELDYYESHNIPELERKLIHSTARVINIQEIEDCVLTEDVAIGAFLLLMKYRGKHNIKKLIQTNIGLFNKLLSSPPGDNNLSTVLYYLAGKHYNTQEASEIAELLRTINQPVGEEFMAVARDLIEQIYDSKQAGKAEGLERVARNMLEANMPVGAISKYTGLSDSNIQRLKESIK